MSEASVVRLDGQRQEQRAEALKQVAAMKGLLSSAGWEIVCAFAREQIAARDGQLYGDPGCATVDYIRGEGATFRLLVKFPEMVVASAEAALAALDQERRDATSRTSSSSQRRGSATHDPAADDTSGWTADDD